MYLHAKSKATYFLSHTEIQLPICIIILSLRGYPFIQKVSIFVRKNTKVVSLAFYLFAAVCLQVTSVDLHCCYAFNAVTGYSKYYIGTGTTLMSTLWNCVVWSTGVTQYKNHSS